jgi:hypothetical protein
LFLLLAAELLSERWMYSVLFLFVDLDGLGPQADR